MTQLNFSTIVGIGFGAMIVGAIVGIATGNPFFVYVSGSLALALILILGIFNKAEPPTRPVDGVSGPGLPIAALVASCIGASVVGVALGHASRHLISSRGGEGERLSLAALIVGYSWLGLQLGAALWIGTFLAFVANA